ncbi:MAG: dethiobiotin synthase [Elusimicrobia bacterium]|nr:dethiobiotin synthase [Elusimicrobiota bacterium]
MKAIFVTGTDTNVGKTVVSGLLARCFLDRGYRVITQKWIQTGSNLFPVDIEMHLRFMMRGREYIKDYSALVTPYIFKFAASPHLSSDMEKRKIDVGRIKKSFNILLKKFDFVIVEGTGGVLVPYNKKRFIIDIAEELNLPVLVVAANKLGAINHTLLTIEAIKKRNMNILGIVFNNLNKNENKIVLRDNPRIISKLAKEEVLGILPWQKDTRLLYKAFVPISSRIFRKLARK